MLAQRNDKRQWKQINFRSVVSALGIEFIHDLYNQYYPNVNCLRFRNTITYCIGKEVFSYAPKEEWDFIARWFGERFIRGDRELWDEMESYIADPKKKLTNVLEKVRNSNLKEIDDIGLGLLLIDFHYTVLNTIYKINLVQIEHALGYAIDKLCESYFPEKNERNKAIAALIFAEEPTVGVKEEKEFFEMAKASIENNTDIHNNLDFLKKHHKKYAYVHSAYGTEPYSLADYEKKYESIKKKGINYVKNRLAQIESSIEYNLNLKKDYMEKIKGNKILVKNIEFMTKLGTLRDKNKALLGTTMEYREWFLNEISSRKNIPFNDVSYYFLAELCNLLWDGKIVSKNEIEKRKKNIVLYRNEYFTTNVSGVDGLLKKEEVSEIRGCCASGGKAQGVVKKVVSSKDAEKVRSGDIMVSPGTDFDLINAMQIAGGIVTVEGGLLSHASVISRELGIPCIIGVNNATTLLKDGMKVMIDADNEIIKIIEEGKHE